MNNIFSPYMYLGIDPRTYKSSTNPQIMDVQTASTTTSELTLSYKLDFTPSGKNSLIVIVDGLTLEQKSYSLIDSTIYFEPPILENKTIEVRCFNTLDIKDLSTVNLSDVSNIIPNDKQILTWNDTQKKYIPLNVKDLLNTTNNLTSFDKIELQSVPNQMNFILPKVPDPDTKILVYKDGVLLNSSDYVIDGNVCKLNQAVPENTILSLLEFKKVINESTRLQDLSNVVGMNLPDGTLSISYNSSTNLFSLLPEQPPLLNVTSLPYQYISEQLPVSSVELPFTPTDTNSVQTYVDGVLCPDGYVTINGNIAYFSEFVEPGKIIKFISLQTKQDDFSLKTTNLLDIYPEKPKHGQILKFDENKNQYVPISIDFINNIVNTCHQFDILAYGGQTQIPLNYQPSPNNTSLVLLNGNYLRKDEFVLMNDTLQLAFELNVNDSVKVIIFDNEKDSSKNFVELSDINVDKSSLIGGEYVFYNKTSDKFEAIIPSFLNPSLSTVSDIKFDTNPKEGEVLVKSGDYWKNKTIGLSDLKDVNGDLPYHDYVFTWDNIKNKAIWKPAPNSSSGIDYTNAREGYVCTYVSTGKPIFLPIPSTPIPSVEQTIPSELLIPGNTFMVGSDKKLISFDINSILSNLSDKITDLYQKIDSGTSVLTGPLVPFSFTVNDTSTTSIMVTGVYTVNSKNLVFIGSLLQYNDQYTIISNSLKFIGNPIPVIPNTSIITVYKFELGTSFEYDINTQVLKSTYLEGNTIMVFDNGAFIPPDEYIIIDGNISFVENMPQSSIIEYVHFKTTNIDTETFVSDGIISNYTITGTIKNGISQFIVFVGKLYQPASSYSISNQILTFDTIIETGEKITIYHIK